MRVALAILFVVCVGCGGQPAQKTAASSADWGKLDFQRKPSTLTHVQVAVGSVGTLTNSTLDLPAVSPDGNWMAHLVVAPGRVVEPDALFTAQGLESVALVVRPVLPGGIGEARVVCASSACWPAWMPDSKSLAFVRLGKGRSELGLYDVKTGQLRYAAMPFEQMATPAVSPSGLRIAVAAKPSAGEPTDIFVMGLDGSNLRRCPKTQSQWRLWPHWMDENNLVYASREDDKTYLCGWDLQRQAAQRLCEIVLPPSPEQSLQAFVGIPRCISPDGRKFAYYNFAADSISIVDLVSLQQRSLGRSTRCGCWFGSTMFIAGSDTELLLGDQGNTDLQTRLMRGPWLPRWSSQTPGQVLLLTQGPKAWTFDVVRMQLTPGQ